MSKLDEAVSDPNDPEYQARKADKKKLVGGRLRAVVTNSVIFLFKKLKGKSKEELEAEAKEKEENEARESEAKEAAAAAAAAEKPVAAVAL